MHKFSLQEFQTQWEVALSLVYDTAMKMLPLYNTSIRLQVVGEENVSCFLQSSSTASHSNHLDTHSQEVQPNQVKPGSVTASDKQIIEDHIESKRACDSAQQVIMI